MKITGRTRLFTILSHPATHVVAPAVYNHIFEELRLDMAYLAHDVPPHALGDTVQAFHAWENLDGFNVTIPHKHAAWHLLDCCCPVSSRIHAVNTVVRNEDGTLAGYNTDGIGALKAIGDVRRTHCLVLGAGGAARAIVDALLTAGAHRISVLNRSRAAASALLDIFASERISLFGDGELEGVDIVVQATPIVDHIPFDLDLRRLRKSARILETVMRPTALSEKALDHHLDLIPGFAMLYHQTKRNFSIFTGIDVPDMVLENAFQSIGYKRP